jgi:hypothetical protein
MKMIKHLLELARNEAETIAVFGDAKLVKTLNRKYELRGGSRQDRIAAREWISLFFHDAVVREL